MLTPAAPQREDDRAWADGSGDLSPRSARCDVLAINRVGFMGGVERILLSAASETRRLGWATALACPPGDLADEADPLGTPVHLTELPAVSRSRVDRSPASWLAVARQVEQGRSAIAKAVREARPLILHTHHPVVAVQAWPAARQFGIPIIWHVHETAPMPLAYRAVGLAAARLCDMFICVSRASRDMVRELGAPESRTRLIYNAADPRFFAPVEPAPGIWPQGPNIGLFGVLEPRKGHADLIRAAAMLSEARPDLQLWMVGGPSFEKHAGYRQALERLAQALGVADRVHFTGRRTDVPALMARMDLVVCASVCSESLPTTLIEAAALGRPVVTTDVGGAAEIVRNLETGLITPPGAPEKLAEAIDFALSPEGARLGARAQSFARLRFSPARFGQDLDDCYRQLLCPAETPR